MNFILLVGILFFLTIIFIYLKRWPITHRQRLLSYPTPESWINDLERFLPAYKKMRPASKKLFIDRLKIHLAEVPCLAIADCQIDTQKRLLALAPWCALTLYQTDPTQNLKRVMFLMPEEITKFNPMVEENELLVVWHDDHKKISNHPNYESNNLLQRNLDLMIVDKGLGQSPSWEELVFTNVDHPSIEMALGWRAKI